ncbi:MAG: TRAP transporter small permease [Pseudomonadota bacterium]
MAALRWLERHLEEVICCSCLVVISCCVFLQVIARYIFETALHWTEEVAAFAMVWAVYMGAALCVRERFHIRIIVGVKSLPERFGRWVLIVADLLWAFFCIFMIKVSWDYLAVLWRFTSTTPSLGINELYPQSVLLVGYALMLFRLAQLYVVWIREGAQGLPGMLDEDGADPVDEAEQHL